MAENPIAPAPASAAGTMTTLLPVALAVFALVLGCFGGLSYGLYNFGATWYGLGFFVGIVGLFIVLLSALKTFFGKFTGRIIFSLWLTAILGAYFFYLFHNNKYPMGIDLAGGTELIYRLDYSQTERNIAAEEKALNAARAKDPTSKESRDHAAQVDGLKASIKTAPDKAAEVVRRRIDPTGTKGIPVTTFGSDKQALRIQLPKATPEEVNRIKTAIETQGRLTFHIVADAQNNSETVQKTTQSATKTYTDASGIEYEVKIMKKPKQYSDEEIKEPVVLQRVPGMDGSKITLAMARHSQESANWEIGVRFSPQGRVEFSNLTGNNVHKQMAIVLDGTVYSAPVIQERIDGECRISGSFGQEEAERLAAVLTAGSLPAEVKYENEFTVGPTLGSEQIASGMQATVIGTTAVIGFMFVYYRMCGAIAALCTAFNILLLLGAMGFFKATLTLPGIAGIVLTLGMSVDANVLILERIREEFQRGRPLRLAVAHGFDRAFLTIIDCNLTTLISGVVLYYLGTGPVRGFAVTLSIGILSTLLCNLWMNQIMMEWLVSREAFGALNMMQFFKNPNLDFMGWRKYWITTSVSLAVASLALFVIYHKDLYDVDFKGGTLVQFNFAPGQAQPREDVYKKMAGEVKDKVYERAEKVLAGLKADLAKAQGEGGGVAQPGVASPVALENRIADIERSLKTFDLRPQAFGTPEDGKYRAFTVTTALTDPGIIDELNDQLLESFQGLEPPAVETSGKDLFVRFNAAAGLTPEIVQERVKKGLLEAARDQLNQDIKEPLQAMLNGITAQPDGGYVKAQVSPLPDKPETRKKIETALGSVRLDGRAGGPISRKSSFGSQVAGEMWRDALLALIFANIGVFIYLWFRFEFSGAWGFGAIVALTHDVFVATGGVIAANLAGFPLLIDLNIVAALLTIIGFSVNDTIVVFDRIREVKGMHPTRNYEDIVNEAVNATLSRTILTSLTVLLADVSLLVFGGPTIRGLAWTLLVGFTVGTYSSIFIASPLMIWWYRRFGGGTAPLPAASPARQQGEAASGAEV